MSLFHRHRWFAEDVELVAALPWLDYYVFRTRLTCACGRTRRRNYLDSILILKLAKMGLRDVSYQDKALELAEQMTIDRDACIV
jgi:hypothetical protein